MLDRLKRMMARPRSILICPDEFNLPHVGVAGDGRQFFLTTPFAPERGGQERREFIALYLFDGRGNMIEARIDDLGPRVTLDREQADLLFDRRLSEIEPVRIEAIRVKPFAVCKFGVTFGLIVKPPESSDDQWWVTAEPGDFLAFTPPWDGRYST